MSAVSESAQIGLQIADFAMLDSVNKVNVVGLFVDALGFFPGQNITSRFAVVGEILVPRRLTPIDITIELSLLDSAGDVVEVPGPMEPQKLRIGQVATVERPSVLGGTRLPEEFPVRHTMVIDFGNGLPLPAGEAYLWQLRIDGDDEHAYNRHFVVTGQPQMPVVG